MKRFSNLVVSSFGVLALCTVASAQFRGRAPYPPQQGGYGYGYGQGQQQSITGRVLNDVFRAAERSPLDGHDRNHVNEVTRSLREFDERLARGKFDTGKLDKAISNLDHLAQADRVRGRERDLLMRDVDELRRFRATRGGYDQNWNEYRRQPSNRY
jgi:hypothetical protein